MSPYQGKSTTGCDDQLEDYHEWTAVPDPEPVPVRSIIAFSAVHVGAFVALIVAANVLVWALSMIGG